MVVRPQFEVFCQFFIAYFDPNGTYVDSLRLVARRYFLNISYFSFDVVTSLPWSYLDYWAYLVLFLVPRKCAAEGSQPPPPDTWSRVVMLEAVNPGVVLKDGY